MVRIERLVLLLIGLGFAAPPSAVVGKDVPPFLVEKNGLWGFVDRAGEVVVPTEYAWATPFENGYAFAMRHGQTFLLDESGHEVLAPETYALLPGAVSKSGLVWAADENGRRGFVNLDGEVVIPFEHDHALPVSNGRAVVRKGSKYGFIDEKGQVVVPLKYDTAMSFSGNRAAVLNQRKWSFIDLEGNEVVPFEFDYVGSVSEGRIAVRRGGEGFHVDLSGQPAYDDRFAWTGDFHEGLAAFDPTAGRLWNSRGFVRKDGSVVVEPRFDSVGHFSGGLCPAVGPVTPNALRAAALRLAGREVEETIRCGYVDDDGDFVFTFPPEEMPPSSTKAGQWSLDNFRDGLAHVRTNTRQGYVNRRGHWVWWARRTTEAEREEAAVADAEASSNPHANLWAAIQREDAKRVAEILAANPRVAHGTRKPWVVWGDASQPLRQAAGRGKANLVAPLLEQGADPDGNHAVQLTPLHAVLWTDGEVAEIVDLLLTAGASASVADSGGSSPLHETATWAPPASDKIVARLLAARANPNATDRNGDTPLNDFVERAEEHTGVESIVRDLLKAGADPNVANQQGQTPLHHAAEWGHAGLVATLLEAGADPRRPGPDGETPLQVAARLLDATDADDTAKRERFRDVVRRLEAE